MQEGCLLAGATREGRGERDFEYRHTWPHGGVDGKVKNAEGEDGGDDGG